MKLFKLTFESNPDLVVNAKDEEHAKEVALQVHEFELVETSKIKSITPVKTLGQLFGF